MLAHFGRLAAVAASLALAANALPAQMSVTRLNTVRVTIPAYGSVVSTSPLKSGDREPGGNVYVSGTVTVQQNSAWRLEARLSTPFVDMAGNSGKVKATNEVRAIHPGGGFTPVTTDDWVTVASGTGPTASTAVPVKYLVVWGKTSAKNPALAESAPLVYRIVPA